METLRVGKSVELLWRESTSMDFDEELRLDIFNKSIKKRLELIHKKEQQSARVIEEKVIRSGRKFDDDGLIVRKEEGFNRYNSEQDQDIWNTEEFGDMDQFEKMMLMKSFKKKKIPQKSMNSRYNIEEEDSNTNTNSKYTPSNPLHDYTKGFDPVERSKRRKESLTLIKIVSRLVLNMIKHQSKRNEINSGALKKHKDIGYQMLRKHMKGFEGEVNREEEVELFIERFCPETVTMVFEEFKDGKRFNLR